MRPPRGIDPMTHRTTWDRSNDPSHHEQMALPRSAKPLGQYQTVSDDNGCNKTRVNKSPRAIGYLIIISANETGQCSWERHQNFISRDQLSKNANGVTAAWRVRGVGRLETARVVCRNAN